MCRCSVRWKILRKSSAAHAHSEIWSRPRRSRRRLLRFLWPYHSQHMCKIPLHTPLTQGAVNICPLVKHSSLIPLPRTRPLQSFCTENVVGRCGAAWLGPARVCSCVQSAEGQRAGRVGAYLTGPWRLVQVPHRRAERSGAPGARATKRLQDGWEAFKYSLAHLFVIAG